MPRDQSFHDYIVHDLLKDLPGISSRSMFGGWGIYKDGVFFAIIADGQLYFKVGDENRKDYEERGSSPFTYTQGKKPMTMSYWLVPEEVMEDSQLLELWMMRSVQVSLKSKRK